MIQPLHQTTKSWGEIMEENDLNWIKDVQKGDQRNIRMSDQSVIKQNYRGMVSDKENFKPIMKNDNSSKVIKPSETNEKKLQTRQRQLDIGKQTEGYKKYIDEVKRKDRTIDHPRTPDKYIGCSTRSWQGSVRVWRRKLHYWDPPTLSKSQQFKFCNISSSAYLSDGCIKEDDLLDEKCRIVTGVESNDDASEENSQNSSEEMAMDLNNDLVDEPITESMLFWDGI